MADKRVLGQRIAQVSNWLREAHAAPFPTSVRWRHSIVWVDPNRIEHELLGCTTVERRTITIDLSRQELRTFEYARDILLHEWAHGVCTTYAHVEAKRESEHDDQWALAYGRIYRSYYEQGGHEECARYPKRHIL